MATISRHGKELARVSRRIDERPGMLTAYYITLRVVFVDGFELVKHTAWLHKPRWDKRRALSYGWAVNDRWPTPIGKERLQRWIDSHVAAGYTLEAPGARRTN
jgi:hypothetical protein